MARTLMYKGISSPIPFSVREYIFQLIRYHGLPLWFMDKSNLEKQLLGLSQQINLRDLALVAEADVKGRICNDKAELEDRVSLFREMASNYSCLYEPFPFENGLTRFTYFSKHDSSPDYIPYDDTQFEVVLLSGLPGAGKDSWIQIYAHNVPVISLDSIRVELKIKPTDNQGRVIQLAKERARVHLRKKQPFVWNATNLSQQRRQALVQLFNTYKARIKIVYLEVPHSVLIERNRKRKDSLPLTVLNRFIDRMEIPQLSEAHKVEYYLDST